MKETDDTPAIHNIVNQFKPNCTPLITWHKETYQVTKGEMTFTHYHYKET